MPAPTSYGTKYELFNVDFQRGDVFHFFNENQRSEYFNSKRISRGTINSYIRVDESFRVGDTYADILACNYCRYDNDDGAGWRYAYVTKMEVVSTTVTELFIQQDPWQNNMFSFEFHGTRLRGHVDRITTNGDTYSRVWSYTPEQLNCEPVIDATTFTHRDFQYLWYVFSRDITASAGETDSTLFTDGGFFIVFPVATNITDLTYVFGPVEVTIPVSIFEFLDNNEYIVNKFYSSIDPLGLNVSYLGNNRFSVSNTVGGASVRRTISNDSQGCEVLVYRADSSVNWSSITQSVKSTIGIPSQEGLPTTTPTTIRNKRYESKLFEYPYRFFRFGCGAYRTQIFNELINGDTNCRYVVVPSTSGCEIILQAPNGYNSASERVINITAPISISAPVRRNVENTYLASNEYKMSNSVIDKVLIGLTQLQNPIGAGVNVAGGIADYFAQREDLKKTPDTATQGNSAGVNVLTDACYPYLLSYAPKDDEENRLYSFFYTYGYTINEWQEKNYANIRSRYYFDYYQYAADVHADIDDSATARDIMQEDLQNGVTFWHYTDNGIGIQHRYENLEVSLLQ